MKSEQVRQGDVYVRRGRIPAGAAPVPLDPIKGVVLAYGEVTGHAHVVQGDVELLSVADQADRFLRVRSRTAMLVHDEHGPITIERGTYRIRIQREYSPEAIRNVVD